MDKIMPKFESLLRAHPAEAPVRPHLATQTLQLAVQARRVRVVKRWLGTVAAVAMLLMLTKWLSNDLLYLLQLSFTKAGLVRAQVALYLQAVWESLPKAQTIAIAVAVAPWLAWRRFETSLTRGRITSIKQGSPLMKLIKFTPRLAVASSLLGVAALGVSGYTYAQKVEQHKLEILRTHINQSGRTEIQTNADDGTCPSHTWETATATFEVKKGHQVSPTDATQLIKAACLEAAAESLVTKKFTPNSSGSGMPVYQITGRTGSQLALLSYYNGQAQTSQQTLTPDVKIYDLEHDTPSSLEALKPGTLILPEVQWPDLASGQLGSWAPRPDVGIVVILPSAPGITWHDPGKQNELTRIVMCVGNPQDRCTFTGSVDFFPAGGGEGNTVNPNFKGHESTAGFKEIAGVITAIEPTSTTIKSSSGRLFTINFGSNPAAEFNQHRSANYNGQQVKVGDTLLVRYDEPADQHSATIENHQIFNAVLMLEFAKKTDSLKKY